MKIAELLAEATSDEWSWRKDGFYNTTKDTAYTDAGALEVLLQAWPKDKSAYLLLEETAVVVTEHSSLYGTYPCGHAGPAWFRLNVMDKTFTGNKCPECTIRDLSRQNVPSNGDQ